MTDMNTLFSAFSLHDLQAFQNIVSVMQTNELNVDDILQYVHSVIARPKIYARACPVCGLELELSKVNAPGTEHIGHHYKTKWHCGGCGYKQYSRRSIVGQMGKMARKELVPSVGSPVTILPRPLISMPCVQCGEPSSLWPVKIPKGSANLHGYRCVWQCLNCGHEEYSTRSLKEEATTLRRI